jgi:hypothetical protein
MLLEEWYHILPVDKIKVSLCLMNYVMKTCPVLS